MTTEIADSSSALASSVGEKKMYDSTLIPNNEDVDKGYETESRNRRHRDPKVNLGYYLLCNIYLFVSVVQLLRTILTKSVGVERKACGQGVEFFTITQSWQCWQYCQPSILIYLQFSAAFAPIHVSKCEIRN